MREVLERLNEIIAKKGTRLCFSGDVEDPEKLLILVEKVAKHIAEFKTSYFE